MDALSKLQAQAEDWGYVCETTSPSEIVERFVAATAEAIANFGCLPAKDPCNDCSTHSRVCVTIPVDRVLFDQLMNSSMGYRAHYALSVEAGETFNAQLLTAVVPRLVEAEALYRDLFSVGYCADSLTGPYSKLWYPKQFTDPSVPFNYANWPEVISIPNWRAYWRERPKPRKGLLAPIPDEPEVLLNGTFVAEGAKPYEQKPFRSHQLHASGWT
jgi:hypothetical protein